MEPAGHPYLNPVLPGFHPDPSVCRVGGDLYLVNSTFEMFPGVPLFHSRDLVNWRPIGHCLTRESQLPLKGARSWGGIYAPTLRFHDGLFHMITTNVGGGGNFLVTAKDPAGPWSDPVWIPEEQGGIDPSLLFDEDDKVYFTRQGGGERGGVFQAEIDVKSGRLREPARMVWAGTGGIWPEGPHLYRIGGTYYLMIAEGGTGYDHCVTVARASSPWGPFEACPKNPILTHRHLADSPIQALGHADLVETADGSWWLFFLGIRPKGGKFHHMGRETFLAPVEWKDGWPVVNGGQPVTERMAAPRLAPHPWDAESPRDDFDKDRLAFCWNFVRNPRGSDWSLSERPGHLRLKGSPVTLDDVGSPAFVGRRQEHFDRRVSALLDFEPAGDGEEAGLTVRAQEDFRYDLFVSRREGKRCASLRRRVKGGSVVGAGKPLGGDPVTLVVEAREERYLFSCECSGRKEDLGEAPTRDVSTEVAGGFTGVYLGMYATGNGAPCSVPADFDWFEYARSVPAAR